MSWPILSPRDLVDDASVDPARGRCFGGDSSAGCTTSGRSDARTRGEAAAAAPVAVLADGGSRPRSDGDVRANSRSMASRSPYAASWAASETVDPPDDERLVGRSSRSFSAWRTRFWASAYDEALWRLPGFAPGDSDGRPCDRRWPRPKLWSSGTDGTVGPDDVLGAPDERNEGAV